MNSADRLEAAAKPLANAVRKIPGVVIAILVVAAGIYLVALFSEIFGAGLVYNYVYSKVLDTGSITNPYYLKAISFAAAMIFYATLPTVMGYWLKFQKNQAALWTAVLYCGALVALGTLTYFQPTYAFNIFTGEARRNYYQAPDGRIELFDKAYKFHPQLGEPLKPVTPEIMRQYHEQQSQSAKPQITVSSQNDNQATTNSSPVPVETAAPPPKPFPVATFLDNQPAASKALVVDGRCMPLADPVNFGFMPDLKRGTIYQTEKGKEYPVQMGFASGKNAWCDYHGTFYVDVDGAVWDTGSGNPITFLDSDGRLPKCEGFVVRPDRPRPVPGVTCNSFPDPPPRAGAYNLECNERNMGVIGKWWGIEVKCQTKPRSSPVQYLWYSAIGQPMRQLLDLDTIPKCIPNPEAGISCP